MMLPQTNTIAEGCEDGDYCEGRVRTVVFHSYSTGRLWRLAELWQGFKARCKTQGFRRPP